MLRACLSGEPSCTGIAPCKACDKAMLTRVLPAAMVAGGFNGSPVIAKAFFDEYARAHDRLLTSVAEEMTRAQMAQAETEAPPPPPPPPPPEPTPPPSLTEEELVTMGTAAEMIEEEPEEVSPTRRVTATPKAARTLARRARALKEQRASEQQTAEKEE